MIKKDGILELFNSINLKEYKTLGNQIFFYNENYSSFNYISEYKFYVGCIVDFKENEFSIKANLLLEIPKPIIDKEFKNILNNEEEKFIEIWTDIKEKTWSAKNVDEIVEFLFKDGLGRCNRIKTFLNNCDSYFVYENNFRKGLELIVENYQSPYVITNFLYNEVERRRNLGVYGQKFILREFITAAVKHGYEIREFYQYNPSIEPKNVLLEIGQKGLTNPETSTLIRSGKNKKSKDAKKLYEIVYVSINESGKIIEYKNVHEISSKEKFDYHLKCFNETRNAFGLKDYNYNEPKKQLSLTKK